MPKVSIIVPNYNHSRYLKQRIDSIIGQTYQDFELILLDDLSTDNSRDIIEQYRHHPKVSNIVFNSVNSGSPFKQWEKGISIATGKYVWIAESDDYADDSFLKSLMGIIEENKAIGLAFCGSNAVDDNGKLINEAKWEIAVNKGYYYSNNGYDICEKYLFSRPLIPNASSAIFRRENFLHVNKSFKDYKVCGDWQFWVDVCFEGEVAYLPQQLNFFRQSDTSVSRVKTKDNYKFFLLEKLRIGLYVYEKCDRGISFIDRLKYIDDCFFMIILESSRRKIKLRGPEMVFVYTSLFRLSPLSVLIFFKSGIKVLFAGLAAATRKITKQH